VAWPSKCPCLNKGLVWVGTATRRGTGCSPGVADGLVVPRFVQKLPWLPRERMTMIRYWGPSGLQDISASVGRMSSTRHDLEGNKKRGMSQHLLPCSVELTSLLPLARLFRIAWFVPQPLQIFRRSCRDVSLWPSSPRHEKPCQRYILHSSV
jgi:hypothetical protein